MPKPFLSFDDQLHHLAQNKNLIIPDPAYAKTMLQQIGYFGLIGGYKTPSKIQQPRNIVTELVLRILLLFINSMKICGNFS